MNFPEMLATPTTCFIGDCLEADHSQTHSRYQIALPVADGQGGAWWLDAVEGVQPRRGDRVLLMSPANADQPVIVGVLAREDVRQTPKNTIRLEDHDYVRVTTSDGRPLVEVGKNVHGPVVRLCGRDVQLDVPGHLKIAAGKLDLESRSGDLRINADEEVILEGDMIRMN